MNMQKILITVILIGVVAFTFTQTFIDANNAYNMNQTTPTKFKHVQQEQQTVANKAESIQSSLQDLKEGNLQDFVFAMPGQIANILVLLLSSASLAHSTLVTTITGLGIPNYIIHALEIIIILIVVLKIASVWAGGKI